LNAWLGPIVESTESNRVIRIRMAAPVIVAAWRDPIAPFKTTSSHPFAKVQSHCGEHCYADTTNENKCADIVKTHTGHCATVFKAGASHGIGDDEPDPPVRDEQR
jgi:hypothetical protein